MFRKAISVMVTVVLISGMFYQQPVTVQAEKMSVNEELNQEITTLSIAMRNVLRAKEKEIVSQIKDIIIDEGYDYELTMESVSAQNPYKDIQYVDLITAYMACKVYYEENGLGSFPGIAEVPLLTYTIDQETLTEAVPVKVETYSKDENGNITEDGYTYIDEESDVDQYEKNGDGTYSYVGKQHIKPKLQTTKYGVVTFTVMDAEALMDYYKVDKETAKDESKKRTELLTKETDDTQIYQTAFAKTPTAKEPLDMELYGDQYKSLEDQRLEIIKTAETLIGQVPYQWGGKARYAGYNTDWWLFNESNEQKGLDCSGFVQWTYMTAGYPKQITNLMQSTDSIMAAGFQQVGEDELKIGDIGIRQGSVTNHAGIYAGEVDGKKMWIHCSSDAGTVIVSEYNFNRYYTVLDNSQGLDKEKDTSEITELVCSENETDNTTETEIVDMGSEPAQENGQAGDETESGFSFSPDVEEKAHYTDSENQEEQTAYDETDILLLAQLITHEAKSEGLNGWVAVGEVVKNRIQSELFPDTLREVIYQSGQFANISDISNIKPSDEVMRISQMVLDGQVSILNNTSCLYFRNPSGMGISSDMPVDWGKYKYYTAVGKHAFYLQN